MSFESAMASVGATPTPAAPTSTGPAAATESPVAHQALSNALEGKAPDLSATPPADQAASPAEPPKESASQTFQALAKERKRVLDLQRQMKERDTAFDEMKKRMAELEGKATTAKPKDPISALQAAGYSYEDATKFILNNSELTQDQQVKAVRDEIAALRAQAEDEKREAKEREERSRQENETRAVTEFKGQIAEFLTGNAETFELLSQEDPGEVQGLVYNLIAQSYANSVEESKTTGQPPRILSVKEGAELAEQYYEERLEKFYKTKKMQSKYGQKAPEPAQAQAASPSKTLAQAGNAGSAGSRPPARSEAERIQRAMEALERRG